MSQPATCEQFQGRVNARAPIPKGAPVLVGVSGGVDSVVLLHVLVALGYRCQVLHVDHGLRQAEAANDAQFVKDLCRSMDLTCHIVQIDVESEAESTGASLQMVARKLRYEALARHAKSSGIAYVTVGHNQNDQAETILLNLSRGAGPEGLAGMRSMRPLTNGIMLVRPLLGETRDAIVTYAKAANLKWKEDPSNRDETYERARMRHQVLPHLDADAVARSASVMQGWVDQVIRPVVAESYREASGKPGIVRPSLARIYAGTRWTRGYRGAA